METNFKADALIFDIDGVLLDVARSFPEVIRQAVFGGWEKFCGGISDTPGYNAGHERVLKRHGAFNDDYDIAWTLLSMAAASGEKLLSKALPRKALFGIGGLPRAGPRMGGGAIRRPRPAPRRA